jgi:hypothetical protein
MPSLEKSETYLLQVAAFHFTVPHKTPQFSQSPVSFSPPNFTLKPLLLEELCVLLVLRSHFQKTGNMKMKWWCSLGGRKMKDVFLLQTFMHFPNFPQSFITGFINKQEKERRQLNVSSIPTGQFPPSGSTLRTDPSLSIHSTQASLTAYACLKTSQQYLSGDWPFR